WHIDIGHNHIDVAVRFERRQGFDTVAGKEEVDCSIPDLVAELLQDESLHVRLVVNDQDLRRHAARSTRVSISLRNTAKSIGLARKASAPPSSALRFVSASPYAVIMVARTIRRGAFALGKSSRPLIPGMLMSERIKISDTPAASAMRCSA